MFLIPALLAPALGPEAAKSIANRSPISPEADVSDAQRFHTPWAESGLPGSPMNERGYSRPCQSNHRWTLDVVANRIRLRPGDVHHPAR
jgi:hypothetical protein